MSDQENASNSLLAAEPPKYLSVDETTRARIGAFAARGLSAGQIADILFLETAQVEACKESLEYKTKYAETANQIIDQQFDLEDGWNVVEEKALGQIIETLEYNRDPKYALFAAKTANAAIRRRQSASDAPKVIENRTVNNVIVLNLNKNFVNKATTQGNMIDVSPKLPAGEIPQRQIDLPSPTAVENLLAPVRATKKEKMLTELEQAFEFSGVFKED